MGPSFPDRIGALGFCKKRLNGTRAIIPTFSAVITAEFVVAKSIERSAPMGEWRSAQESGRLLIENLSTRPSGESPQIREIELTLGLRGRRRRVQNAIRLVRYHSNGSDSTAETLFTFTTPRKPS
jgi:hypothetical protein